MPSGAKSVCCVVAMAIALTACAPMHALRTHGDGPSAVGIEEFEGLQIDRESASGAAIGSAPIWAWLGRAIFQLISNTAIKIDVQVQDAPASGSAAK